MGVRLPRRYPDAEWHPIPNYNGWPPPHDVLYAEALIGHSAEGNGAPPSRFYDGKSAGSHFWNFKDGRFWQLCPLDQPAWANGQLNRVAPPTVPLVVDWYRRGVNPNWFTVSIEHEGFAGELLTEAQVQNDIALGIWLESSGLKLSLETFFGHGEISATACPSGRIPFARILNAIHSLPKQEDDMTPDEVREIVRKVVQEELASRLTADRLNEAITARDTLRRVAAGPIEKAEAVAAWATEQGYV